MKIYTCDKCKRDLLTLWHHGSSEYGEVGLCGDCLRNQVVRDDGSVVRDKKGANHDASNRGILVET